MFFTNVLLELNRYKPYVHLTGVAPYQDLSAIREFEQNRKPIRPGNVMTVKEGIQIILASPQFWSFSWGIWGVRVIIIKYMQQRLFANILHNSLSHIFILRPVAEEHCPVLARLQSPRTGRDAEQTVVLTLLTIVRKKYSCFVTVFSQCLILKSEYQLILMTFWCLIFINLLLDKDGMCLTFTWDGSVLLNSPVSAQYSKSMCWSSGNKNALMLKSKAVSQSAVSGPEICRNSIKMCVTTIFIYAKSLKL